ncbi:MAG: hypothetical protein ACK46X_12375 [Candidatus Sericytochromatia bacterium]
MTTHAFLSTTLASTLLIAGLAAPAVAQSAVEADSATQVRVGGRLQLMGLAEWLQQEQFRSQGRVFAFLKQSRLDVSASVGEYDFYSQLALGGEDVYTNNVNLTLLDMFATGPLLDVATWRLGQFRVPYGRELMTNGGNMAFWDRSITSPFFQMGRDVGAALEGDVGPANVIGGVFLGGGRDVPQRYLPEILGIPLVAARVTFGDLEEDTFNLSQHAGLDADRTRQGVGFSGFFTRDSRVGHSTVLNVKNSFEKNLLLSAGWNPYIGKKDPATGEAPQGQFWQAGVDYAARTPFHNGTLTGEAELNYGNFANTFGSLGALGGRSQVGFHRNPYEVALRYALVVPDARMAATNATAGPSLGQTTAITPDGSPIQELTPAFTYFLNGDKLKLVVDLPILINAPIVTENKIGSYNMINQPDQTGLLTNPANTLSRQVVFQLRAGVQYAF